MKITDLLCERRSGTLYHWMTDQKAEHCFKHDEMPARWEHYIPTIGKDFMGNSFSRNKRLILYYDYRLEIDQAKLATRYRIIPVDGNFIFHGNPKKFPSKDQTKRFVSHNHLRDRIENVQNALAEEFVIGDIKQLHLYIMKIEFHGHIEPNWLIEYCEKFKIKLTGELG